MTIAQALKFATTKLSARKINLPHLEAEILLSEILKKPREFLLAHDEFKLSAKQILKFKSKISRRLKGEPIAYLTGYKEFYGLDFKVNKDVLIPRPETELMVEEALKLVTRNSQPVTLIDIGTGSGCIIITLAKQIAHCDFLATDISTKALAVAKKNAKFHGVTKSIKFLQGNLLEPFIKILDSPRILRGGNDKKKKLSNFKFVIRNSQFVIVANLPYLTPTQIKNSPSIKHEPKLALIAGPDGLKYYRQLFQQINKLRVASASWRSGLRAIHALCEIDPRQTAKIKQLIKRELPEAKFQIKKDLAGLNRLVIIKIN